MLNMLFDEQKLAEADDRAAKAAQGYQDHVYALKIFESLSKDMLAALKMEMREQYGKASDAELETRARASEKWKIFRDEQIKILKEAGRKQIQYENAQRRFEAARSGFSMRRAEVGRLIS